MTGLLDPKSSGFHFFLLIFILHCFSLYTHPPPGGMGVFVIEKHFIFSPNHVRGLKIQSQPTVGGCNSWAKKKKN